MDHPIKNHADEFRKLALLLAATLRLHFGDCFEQRGKERTSI